jgi:hypothetical protein
MANLELFVQRRKAVDESLTKFNQLNTPLDHPSSYNNPKKLSE